MSQKSRTKQWPIYVMRVLAIFWLSVMLFYAIVSIYNHLQRERLNEEVKSPLPMSETSTSTSPSTPAQTQ